MKMMMALIFVALMLILGETFINIRSARLKLGQIKAYELFKYVFVSASIVRGFVPCC